MEDSGCRATTLASCVRLLADPTLARFVARWTLILGEGAAQWRTRGGLAPVRERGDGEELHLRYGAQHGRREPARRVCVARRPGQVMQEQAVRFPIELVILIRSHASWWHRRRCHKEVCSCIHLKCLRIMNWVLGLYMIILGGKGHVLFYFLHASYMVLCIRAKFSEI